MARIEQVLARVYVDDLDRALDERLAEGAAPRRSGFRAVELAWVGPFLLLAGAPDVLAPFRDRAATVLVDDVEAVAGEVESGRRRAARRIRSGAKRVAADRVPARRRLNRVGRDGARKAIADRRSARHRAWRC